MTTSPRDILAAATAFASADQADSFTERADLVELLGRLDREAFDRWTSIAAAGSALGVSVTIRDETNAVVNAGDFAGTPFIRARITIGKPSNQTTFYFLTIKGLTSLIDDDDLSSRARRVLTAEQTSAFAAVSCRFEPWTARVPDEDEPDPLAKVNPRRFVRDLVGERVPILIGDALLSPQFQDDDSPAMRAWRGQAVRRLRAALANEIGTSATGEVVTLQGARTVNIEVEPNGVASALLFKAADEAAQWVFASGQDIDTRHVMFTHELAREWQDGRNWYDGFSVFAPRALASARNVYRKYLSTTSNETLKALEDLRKTLNDEIVKVTQQTRDLTSGLWRDFAIVLSAIVARLAFVVAGDKAADSQPVTFVVFGVAAYLVITLGVNLYGNAKFGKIARSNREAWRVKLYGFLTEEDFTALADQPVKLANDVYRTTVWAVALGYVAMIVALMLNGLLLPASRQHPPNTSTQHRSTAGPKPTATHGSKATVPPVHP